MQAIWFLPLIISTTLILAVNFLRTPYRVGLHSLSLVFLVTYGLSGWYSWYNYQNDLQIYPNFIRNDFTYIMSACLIFLSYFISLYGYKFIHKVKTKRTKVKLNNLVRASNISFIMMLLFIFIYVIQYGGLSNALNTAAIIRSGYGELESSGQLTFTKYLMPIGVFPFLTYAYLTFIDKKKNYFIPFIITSSFLLLAFILMSGRTRIIMYLITFGILLLLASERKISLVSLSKFSPLIIVSAFVLVYGKQVFSSIGLIRDGESVFNIINSTENNNSFFDSLFGYFSHRVYSVEAALNNLSYNNGTLVFFRDSFFIPLYFIPERLTGISKPDSISFHNTELLTGIYDSMAPPGVLAYGIYSLWIPGIFIIAFFYGAGFGLIDKIFLENYNNKKILIILLPILLVWSLYGSTGDSRIIINGTIYIILFLLILLVIKAPSSLSKN